MKDKKEPVEIRTIHQNGRLYMNKFDIIKFLEIIRKDAMSMECRSKLQRIISTFMAAN